MVQTNVSAIEHNKMLAILGEPDIRASLSLAEIDALGYCAGQCALNEPASQNMLKIARQVLQRFSK